ncbi:MULTISPECIES: AMP-binding protein [Pseudonocardia]|uniref:Long-chain-fatty-acid--CoA ligase n=2 Tax=Pseudonocardia TaxID=1847 RepID=A0A1Y2N6V9_PSEAH|nr:MULTISPECIES: AMP-binding protein [Pseudonocardia]OSY43206.1 Long-chain-fatty-acid--CoA ligase [Pseudonocardia autotrophica]TDN71694.1 acyl-CoA synthetase (AMP-forming)/AMP-acid ligase II [Pseudonocardia autotrophica]BBG02381.1 AMP-dependent acyl-CoA synthetase [Pseudonocardia autotrophica]GEC23283.1 AMP-dependent acyl-CoA synthetase [Pseudonocardia saturnea]
MDLSTLIRSGAREHPEHIALRCDAVTLTYRDLHERSCRLDNALADLGVRAGDRVATLTDNSPESLELILGIALGGYVRASLYTHNTASTNVGLLNAIGATVLIAQRSQHDLIAPHLGAVAGLRHVIVLDGPAPDGVHAYDELLAAAAPGDRGVEPDPDAPQTIRFSAGTTGTPKGIVHSCRAWTGLGTETAAALMELGPDDTYLAAGPLAHATIMPVFGVLAAGGSVVVLRAFEPGAFLAAIERHRCTVTFGVPTMVQVAAAHPAAADTDVSSLRQFVYGGSPMTGKALTRAREVFGEVMLQLYGQSEVAPVTVLSPADHLAEGGRWLRSAGRATPNTRITIVDDQGDPVPTGAVGEVAAHNPTVFDGIWADPEATRARLLADGSVLTRDMGYLDEHGFLFLTDRKEDMIISGGFNIWPTEIENALAEHPAVREASVVGIPHDKWGETPLALVVSQPGTEVTEDELIAWTRERLGPVKRVTTVRFGTELPKTPVGKVLRREVRALHAPIDPPTS